MNYKDIKLVETCGFCPEQYDAELKNGSVVGYLRLRWGYFQVSCPDTMGEIVYEIPIGHGYTGSFESHKQRKKHLKKAKKAIAKWYNGPL